MRWLISTSPARVLRDSRGTMSSAASCCRRTTSRISCLSSSPIAACDTTQPTIRPLAVVYESGHLLAVNKPPGMSFHNDQPNELGLVQTLRAMQRINLLEYQGEINSVHRLDRVTSGIVLFAKTGEAARCLAKGFRERQVHKYYVAISTKKPKKSQGKLAGDMERSRRGAWKLLRSAENPAVTHFRSWGLTGASPPGLRLFVLKPETGKTHQLRVAMKALGSPILGDPTYSNDQEASAQDRCYLHASAIRIPPGVLPAVNYRQDSSAGTSQGVDIVLAPDVGDLFIDPSFSNLFREKVVSEIDRDTGHWFASTKVLSSICLPADAALLAE